MFITINFYNNFSDNIPTVRLATWAVNASLFEGETTAGPCPILFGDDTEDALEAITSDPTKAHYDMMRINRTFLSFEYTTLKESINLVKKPRYTLSKFNQCCQVKLEYLRNKIHSLQ